MRVAGVGVLFALCAFRVASAQAPPARRATSAKPEYPVEVTDRPLLMFAGMTLLDVGIDFPTVNETTVDAMGNQTTTTSKLGHYVLPSLYVRHSFGAVQLFAGTDLTPGGDFYFAGGGIRIGRGVVNLTVTYSSSEDLVVSVEKKESGYIFDERASYTHKTLLVPRRFSLIGFAGVAVEKLSKTPTTSMPTSRTSSSLFASGGGTVQLARRLALYAGPSLNVPLMGTDASTTIDARTQLLVAGRHWDFYGNFELHDLTETRHPFLGFGVIRRYSGE